MTSGMVHGRVHLRPTSHEHRPGWRLRFLPARPSLLVGCLKSLLTWRYDSVKLSFKPVLLTLSYEVAALGANGIPKTKFESHILN